MLLGFLNAKEIPDSFLQFLNIRITCLQLAQSYPKVSKPAMQSHSTVSCASRISFVFLSPKAAQLNRASV